MHNKHHNTYKKNYFIALQYIRQLKGFQTLHTQCALRSREYQIHRFTTDYGKFRLILKIKRKKGKCPLLCKHMPHTGALAFQRLMAFQSYYSKYHISYQNRILV